MNKERTRPGGIILSWSIIFTPWFPSIPKFLENFLEKPDQIEYINILNPNDYKCKTCKQTICYQRQVKFCYIIFFFIDFI